MVAMKRLTFVVFVALVPLAAPLGANLVIPAGFREIIAEATTIVRGRITDVRAVEFRDVGIESIGTVAVESVLKGPAVEFIAVRVPGGVVGRVRHTMTGAPTLRVGQRGVFFLKRAVDDSWRPIGLSQGVYGVHQDPATGQLLVQPPVLGGRTTAVSGLVERGDVRRKRMAVGEFESLVKLVMATPPQRAIPRGGR
jgi:hypothetical protein